MLCCVALCYAVLCGAGERGVGAGRAVSTKAKNLYYVCEEKNKNPNKLRVSQTLQISLTLYSQTLGSFL